MIKTLCLALLLLPVGCGITEPVAGKAETLMLFVGPERTECMTVIPTTCLQVRFSPEGSWENFSDPIEGFEFEPGFLYELRVRRIPIADPPADGSSFRWILLELVSKNTASLMFGLRITFWTQPHGTFGFLFNEIYYGSVDSRPIS